MTIHTLEPDRRTLHGKFSPDLSPVLTIDPGDTVIYSTLDAGWGLEASKPDGSPRRKFGPLDPVRDSGHALVGPVSIRGAEPGLVLAVTIDAIRPGPWGMTYVGGWDAEMNQRIGVVKDEFVMIWTMDAERLTARNQFDNTISLNPFMGVMGLAPAAPGWHSSAPPRPVGGNIDCKELVQGSTLYLPIEAPGGLFSVGDGHGAQGDGEVCITAIECPMERVALTFDLRPDLRLKFPRANTPAGWITFGFHEDLDEATYIAIEGMMRLMTELYRMDRHHALGLASLVVNLRITQFVNGVRGVHAILPHGAIR